MLVAVNELAHRVATTRDYNGAFRLTGAAGTGKTVVLLHQARELHRRNPAARIALTTFSRTLADALSDQLKTLDPSLTIASDLGKPGIYVAGIDAIALRVLATSPKALGGSDGQPGAVGPVLGPRTAQVLRPSTPQAWAAAADEHAGELPDLLRSASFLEAEYATVVLPNLVTTRDDYLKVRRPGRGVPLNRSRRQAVWNIVETSRAGAAAEGSTDFDEKAAIAAQALANHPGERPADHVLADEAQDLSPCRLQLLRSLVASGMNDLFLAEDSHQRIYGQRIVLSRYGINIVGRARRLTLNYRTTQQNLRYALDILSGEQYTDLGDESETTTGYRSEGSPRRSKNESRTYYRCAARSIAPGSAVLSSHPKNVYLAERAVIGPLNAWIGRLFDREHRDETVRRLAEAGSEASGVDDSRLRQAKKKLADAETRMRRLQLSIEAGVEPAAVADALNRALEECAAARADLDRAPTTNVLTEKKIAEIVDGLGNVAELLNSADPSELAALYAALRLEMVYNAAAKIVGVSIRPMGRGSNRVRGVSEGGLARLRHGL